MLLPLCGEASYFAEADAIPPYPYLWVDHVRAARGAIPMLAALLAADDGPRYVALYQPVAKCDVDGVIDRVLAVHYRRRTTIDGIPVLERRILDGAGSDG